ncbi:MAG: alpha/beta hydrolase [Verrucomicrobia bacterium CG_4_10_14_3_um_filter_43_23]|nr:MAG: alpha/beta hydrolase [Verrucomicrobia bacterium CG1_02_43_26]PIP58895.1 MAG: alpha/beta hydrolase [Verrucomicrobia bacterium CG22_combo_CG10-13_8_21_14_all_43_17]PIX58732.1 MAG: alpha/beta hydrolase [Verrucomicrobia bacterium CG_4_10_14_3_um_filter_43_23]PIY62942.1 MAG: alpha/beta hydrolase [Verrucomicrobia bacterium CG_4_10_14_0_8_um_filter_43_34]PJA43911.1 MAG: alpha/beta hydrolase [Verrucomicrobia bacterium CG_4_9_14_3_um_filter_43_20]
MRKLPEDIRKLYPFPLRDRDFFKVDPLHRMHFLDEGNGTPVIMVHGNPTWSFYYRNLVLGLRDKYRCIVPDHIGCGLSDKPQDYSYTLSTHIDNLSRLIEHLQIERFHLIVHDWGGAIGIGAALKHIDKLDKIVILNTAAFRSKHIPFRIRLCRIPIIGEWIVRALNGFARPATFMAVEKKLPKAVKDGYLFPYNNWANRIAIARFVQDIPLNQKHPSYNTLLGIEEKLHQLKEKAMLICWGKKDFCFNQHFLKVWKERFENAETYVYEKASHYLLEDEGEEVLKEIVKFLAEDA